MKIHPNIQSHKIIVAKLIKERKKRGVTKGKIFKIGNWSLEMGGYNGRDYIFAYDNGIIKGRCAYDMWYINQIGADAPVKSILGWDYEKKGL